MDCNIGERSLVVMELYGRRSLRKCFIRINSISYGCVKFDFYWYISFGVVFRFFFLVFYGLGFMLMVIENFFIVCFFL